jgi:hypothetical protein
VEAVIAEAGVDILIVQENAKNFVSTKREKINMIFMNAIANIYVM